MPKANVPGEQHADGGVEPQAAAARHEPDRERRRDRGDRAADVQRHPEQERDHEPGKRGVADGVADEREALEDDERAHDRADDADEDRGDEAALHEPVAQRVEHEADRVISERPSW